MVNIGEIKLFTYDDIPIGYLECDGSKLEKSKYPRLYMMIGNKYGNCDEKFFYLPNLNDTTPTGMTYCIAYDGKIPNIESN